MRLAFPLPNGPAGPFGFAPFTASYSDLSSLDAASLRLDRHFGSRAIAFARYNYAPSSDTQRLYALSNPIDTTANTRTFTSGGDLNMLAELTAQLEQVLRNLIDNSIKHHDKTNGEVVVTVGRSGDVVDFIVRDDGPGIAPEFHERIFQLFQTLKRRDEVKGSGMGLAVVKRLVDQQNGVITVHSQGNGKGAEFRVRWPLSLSSELKDRTS